jgi:hypothetical protein
MGPCLRVPAARVPGLVLLRHFKSAQVGARVVGNAGMVLAQSTIELLLVVVLAASALSLVDCAYLCFSRSLTC